MAWPNRGCDVVDMAALLNRSTFYGTASASATSTPIMVDNYRQLAVITNFTCTSANTVTAAANAISWDLQASADKGTTWASITEINGTSFGTQTEYPYASPAQNAYVFTSIPAEMVRLKITAAGSASGITAANCWLSMMP